MVKVHLPIPVNPAMLQRNKTLPAVASSHPLA
jgi:hypothetical protein